MPVATLFHIALHAQSSLFHLHQTDKIINLVLLLVNVVKKIKYISEFHIYHALSAYRVALFVSGVHTR